MTPRFNFQKEFGPITKLAGVHVPAFILDAGEPVLFDPGVSAFGPHVPEGACLALWRACQRVTPDAADPFTF